MTQTVRNQMVGIGKLVTYCKTNRKFGAGNPWAGHSRETATPTGILYGLDMIDGILGAVLDTGSINLTISFKHIRYVLKIYRDRAPSFVISNYERKIIVYTLNKITPTFSNPILRSACYFVTQILIQCLLNKSTSIFSWLILNYNQFRMKCTTYLKLGTG